MFLRTAYWAPQDDRGATSEDGRIDDVAADVAAAMAELRGDPKSEAETQEPSQEIGAQKEPRDDGRDERGRFASKQDKAAEEPKKNNNQAQTDRQQAQQSADQQRTEKPGAATLPPEWLSPAGKAKWANVPNDVKADIGRMQQQAAQGLEASRMYADLQPYADRAAHFGQKLSDAMAQYVGIEDLISRDIGAGLTVICRNKGLSQEQAASLFADLARKFGANPGPSNGHAQPGGQVQNDPNDPLIELMQPFLGPLQQKLIGLESQLSNFHATQHEAQVNSIAGEIERFASNPENIYYDDVEPLIKQLFESKIVSLTGNHAADLQKAYDMAVRMHPDVHSAWQGQQMEKQEAARRQREQEAADKARKASRSVSGSRIPGTVVREAANPVSGQDDVMADVIAAYKTVGAA